MLNNPKSTFYANTIPTSVPARHYGKSDGKIHSAAISVGTGLRPRQGLYAQLGKRFLDVAGALFLLLLLSPLIAVLLILVALDGGKPIYSHRRVGLHGREFPCFKIRTMTTDSAARLEKLLRESPAAAAEWAQNFKLKDDPRITPIGRFIRKASLDELPQLWNVVRGDMSLVGPRPVPGDELKSYGSAAGSYMSVRPGLTGAWQISGRNSVSYRERVALDRQYVERLSAAEDLRILFMTVPAVLHMTGR